MKTLTPLLICLLIFFGCASAAQERSLEELPDADFSVDIPGGWWKPGYTNKYLLTKDGPYLQYVLIQQRPLNKAFRYTKKKISAGMLPQEAAGGWTPSPRNESPASAITTLATPKVASTINGAARSGIK